MSAISLLVQKRSHGMSKLFTVVWMMVSFWHGTYKSQECRLECTKSSYSPWVEVVSCTARLLSEMVTFSLEPNCCLLSLPHWSGPPQSTVARFPVLTILSLCGCCMVSWMDSQNLSFGRFWCEWVTYAHKGQKSTLCVASQMPFTRSLTGIWYLPIPSSWRPGSQIHLSPVSALQCWDYKYLATHPAFSDQYWASNSGSSSLYSKHFTNPEPQKFLFKS